MNQIKSAPGNQMWKRWLMVPIVALLVSCAARPMRFSPPPTASARFTSKPATSSAPVERVRRLFNRWRGDDVAGTIRLIKTQYQIWPNTCFGAGYSYETCAVVDTPGWEITVEVEKKAYILRTDEAGEQYRLILAPPPEIGKTIVSWSGPSGLDNHSCLTAEVGQSGIAVGDCGGYWVQGRFINKANQRLLHQHLERFGLFKSDISAGQVSFTGTGTEMPTSADQRAIAELMRLIAQEALAGQASAAAPNAIAYSRERVLPVCALFDVVGRVTISDCQPNGTATTLRLNAGGLDQIFHWLDTLAPFAYAEEGDAKVKLSLAGRGARPVSHEESEAIRTFIEGVIADSREGQYFAGRLRYALPLLLPEGLDWNPGQSRGDAHSFRARAVDPTSELRWFEIQGLLDNPLDPTGEGRPIQIRGTEALMYHLPNGIALAWQEDGTHYLASSSFGLSETLKTAAAVQPMAYEEFQQLMRERAQARAALDGKSP